MKIINLTKNTILSTRAAIANTFIARMVGLLSKQGLNPGESLIITRCNSIHMFFMRFSIDVIFTDRNYKVVGLCKNIQPFQLSPIFLNSFFAIETPTGTIQSTDTALGDQLIIQPSS